MSDPNENAARVRPLNPEAFSRFAVRDGDLVVVGMDFREGEEALTVSAILDKRRLERRLHARHLGEIDIAFERQL